MPRTGRVETGDPAGTTAAVRWMGPVMAAVAAWVWSASACLPPVGARPPSGMVSAVNRSPSSAAGPDDVACGQVVGDSGSDPTRGAVAAPSSLVRTAGESGAPYDVRSGFATRRASTRPPGAVQEVVAPAATPVSIPAALKPGSVDRRPPASGAAALAGVPGIWVRVGVPLACRWTAPGLIADSVGAPTWLSLT